MSIGSVCRMVGGPSASVGLLLFPIRAESNISMPLSVVGALVQYRTVSNPVENNFKFKKNPNIKVPVIVVSNSHKLSHY